MIETIFDTLNAKAAIFGVEAAFDATGDRIPLVISGTITDASGRTLSGQTVEAFYTSIAHARPLAVGLNCALGARQLRAHVADLARITELPVIAYPNAGLPNEFGGYDETAETTSAPDRGLGTRRDHQHRRRLLWHDPGPRPGDRRRRRRCRASGSASSSSARPGCPGLQAVAIPQPGGVFVNVGERTNVTGSRKFAKLILEDRFDEGVEVARQQVEAGANLIDVNMDEAMLDSVEAMTRFLRLIAAEPDISAVPVMIDSSRWDVIEAGLKCVQGKSVVNSISLKEGEAPFLEHARLCRRYGAAVVVMGFDEQGQADTADRKVAVATRAYKLLTEQAGFEPEDIILDPNIFAIGTGHRGTRRLRRRLHRGDPTDQGHRCPVRSCPAGCPTSRSRSAATIRSARRSIRSSCTTRSRQGWTWGSSTPAPWRSMTRSTRELRALVEDLVLDRRPDATERAARRRRSIRR